MRPQLVSQPLFISAVKLKFAHIIKKRTNFDKSLHDFDFSVINSNGTVPMTDKRVVLITAVSKDEAQKIAHALVERRLAACVNITGPIESVYRWKGDVEIAEEWLLFIKTTAAAFEPLRDAIRELHSYELPECIMLPIESGSAEYLNWIAENVSTTT
jgi:periplasmic divalent cation tolerance protein